jgi:hypothetical protein
MAPGGWIRFIVGIVLAVEVLRSFFSGSVSSLALILAAIYILLTAAFVIFRF